MSPLVSYITTEYYCAIDCLSNRIKQLVITQLPKLHITESNQKQITMENTNSVSKVLQSLSYTLVQLLNNLHQESFDQFYYS